ncbi:MAG: hypothetical protein ABIG32_03345 [Candidatus Uhrbacteria bacterium]|nr:hypothetical protein [Patescibacteria group bacterium]MBU1906602.1 hypothetical protein [Patescibacteria group bacterium]
MNASTANNYILPSNLPERNLLLWQIWTARADVLARIDQVFKGKVHERRAADGLCIGRLEEIRVSAAFLFDDICRAGYRLSKVYAALTRERNRGVISLLFVRKLRPTDSVIDLTLKKQPDEQLDRAIRLYRMLSPDIEGNKQIRQATSPVPYSGVYSWDNGPDRPLTLILNGADPVYPRSEVVELRLNGTGIELRSAATLKVTRELELELAWNYTPDGLAASRVIDPTEAMQMHEHVLRHY